jgi:hypothetical protein
MPGVSRAWRDIFRRLLGLAQITRMQLCGRSDQRRPRLDKIPRRKEHNHSAVPTPVFDPYYNGPGISERL